MDKVTCRYHPDDPLIEDYHAGDIICSKCGLVVGDRLVFYVLYLLLPHFKFSLAGQVFKELLLISVIFCTDASKYAKNSQKMSLFVKNK